MAFYLVDYENVNNISGIDKLDESSRVIIFYSKNANTITFDTHKAILAAKASIEYKNVEVGRKNALDFQLSSYLGYLIGEYPSHKFFIVSKDNGFDCLIKFWKEEKGADITLCTNLEGKTQEKEKTEKSDCIAQALANSDIDLSKEDIESIISVCDKYKTMQSVNTYLNKHFRESEKVGAINKIIKPFIKAKS